MEINLFTVGAQIINFIVLVFLLRRFLYRPIIRAMEERQRLIEERFAEAKQARADSEAEARDLRKKREELEDRRAEILASARQEASSHKSHLVKEAQEDVAERHRTWQENLKQEQENFLRELRLDIGRHSLRVTRRALEDLSGAPLEQQVAARFIRQLHDLDEEPRSDLLEAIGKSEGNITVRSAFPLPGELRERIIQAVQELDTSEIPLNFTFEREPELISGIELYASGRKLAWTIDHYLNQFEERIRNALEERASQEVLPTGSIGSPRAED